MYLLIRFFISLLPSGTMRTKWIQRFHIFRKTGKNFYFCPRKLPADPHLIIFHDNVAVATDVTFINHDVAQKVFNNRFDEQVPKFCGCIEVGNNVFIGAKVTILPNIKICDDVFIAAGAIVTKSITMPGIYGGIPAKKIGDFSSLYDERLKYKKQIEGLSKEKRQEKYWELFYEKQEAINKNE